MFLDISISLLNNLVITIIMNIIRCLNMQL